MKSSALKIKPQLVEYLDIHLYLKDLYHFRKNTERDFSYESWAAELNIKSRSFLRLVILGKRTLTVPVFQTIIQKLKLTSDEVVYAQVLFQYSFSSESGLKNLYGKELAKQWTAHVNQVVVEDLETFLADPFIPVAFTYFTCDKSSSDVLAVAKILMTTPARIKNAIIALTKLDLLECNVNDKNEIIYRAKQNYFRVPQTPGFNFLKTFHLDGLEQARKAHDLPFNERKFRSLLMTLSQEQIELAERLINDFATGIFKQMEMQKISETTKVYRLNLQLFPVSEVIT